MTIELLRRAALAALLALPLAGFAEENTDEVALPEWHAETRFAFILGFATGGDTLVDITLSDGTEEKIKAGQGVHFAAGVWRELTPQVILQGTWGYLVDETTASDSSMRFSRYPLDLLVYYRPQDFHIGAGFTRHSGVKFDGDGFLPDTKFKDATGTVIELGYRWFGVRFIDITYESSALTEKFDGGGVEFMINAAFR